MLKDFHHRTPPHPNPLPKGEGTILLCMVALLCASCSSYGQTAPASTQPAFQIVGHIDSPRIPESSGLIGSRKYPGIFWTHNDSGNPAAVFAITREGKLIAEFPINNARNIDWEDITIDEQNRIYLADIGNNAHNRTDIQIHRLAEPDPRGPTMPLRIERTWQLTYPDKPFDAESLFLLNGNGYIISKNLDASPGEIYRFSLDAGAQPIKLEKVAALPLRIPVTAADISSDGRWLAVMTIAGPSIFRIDGDVSHAGQTMVWQALFFDPNVEAVCFISDGLLATTEGRRMIFFPWKPPATQPAQH